MNYVELEIKNETYKLRLNTRATVALEKAIGKNPLDIFFNLEDGELPKISDIIMIFHACLQSYHHGFTIDKVYDLFDDYLASGGDIVSIVTVFIEVFQEAGLIPKEGEVEDAGKNA